MFFPTRGKEPKGDRGQPIRDSTMAAPGPLLAWLGSKTSCCARLIASSRGRHEGTWGVMSLVRWQPGGTGAALVMRELVGFWLHRVARLFFCPRRGHEGCSFPLAGKNQRATGGSQSVTAPWLPPDPSPLGGLGKTSCCARLITSSRGRHEGLGVLCHSSAGDRAARGSPSLRARWWAVAATGWASDVD